MYSKNVVTYMANMIVFWLSARRAWGQNFFETS